MTIKILISALCLIYVYVAIKTIIKIHKDTKRADEILEQLIMELESIEALEQEPVKHGEWINIFDNTWECTNCETCEQFAYNIESTSDYCPNCGARMESDGE